MKNITNIIGYKVDNLEDLKNVVPAAFSDEHNRSRVYSFVSTVKLLENFSKLGWKVMFGSQKGSGKFARHFIRLINPRLTTISDFYPQLILDNSHNGGSCAQLHPALFHFGSNNELVISSPNLFSNTKFRHMGLEFEELRDVLAEMATQYEIISTKISDMKKIILSPNQKLRFAIECLAHRNPDKFIKSDGTIDVKSIQDRVNIDNLLKPMDGGEEFNTLWDVFLTVREWIIKGGFEQKSKSGRKSRSRAITNAIRQINLNKTLWMLAESFISKNLEENTIFEAIEKAKPKLA